MDKKFVSAKLPRALTLSSLLLALSLPSMSVMADDAKIKGELSVMVLGSGGPVATAKGRASAGYLIFTDGKPRVLMDVGGGTFQRLAESGVNIKDVDTVLLSHLHIDHTGDLSAIIKTVYFHNNLARAANPSLSGRTSAINIYGPDSTSFPDRTGAKLSNGELQYPSTENYAHQHYSPVGGVERYLNAFAPAISGGASEFAYTAKDLSSNWESDEIEMVLNEDGLKITSVALNHGPVPAVGFRIDYKGHSIAYSGDTSSKTDNMIALSEDVDLLIYDTAITNTLPANPLFHALHTSPTRIGEVARAAKAKKLVLSHITPVTESRLNIVKNAVREAGYEGEIKKAKDLKVFNFGVGHGVGHGVGRGGDYDADDRDD